MIQVDIAQEGQLLAYLIPVMLGNQLAFYFFYQYKKNYDTNLKLNRILLSYGFFTLFMVNGAFFLVVRRVFHLDNFIDEFFYRIGFSLALSSQIFFLSAISIKEFSSIMNLKLVKIEIIIAIIPILVVLLAGTGSPVFPFTIFLSVLSIYHALGSQIRIIQKSKGQIRFRATQMFIGELIALSALIFALNVTFGFLPIHQIVSYFIGVFDLTIGFLIMFIAANDFPPFYEFEWKMNLQNLFIINQVDNSILFSQSFIKMEGDEEYRKELISGGIMGIEDLITAITDTKDEKINKIKQEDSFILLEYASDFNIPLVFAFIVKKDLDSFRSILKTIKDQFESFFKHILEHYEDFNVGGNEEQVFSSFDIILDTILKE